MGLMFSEGRGQCAFGESAVGETKICPIELYRAQEKQRAPAGALFRLWCSEPAEYPCFEASRRAPFRLPLSGKAGTAKRWTACPDHDAVRIENLRNTVTGITVGVVAYRDIVSYDDPANIVASRVKAKHLGSAPVIVAPYVVPDHRVFRKGDRACRRDDLSGTAEFVLVHGPERGQCRPGGTIFDHYIDVINADDSAGTSLGLLLFV